MENSKIKQIPEDVKEQVIKNCDNFNKNVLALTPLEYYRWLQFQQNHRHKDINKGAIGGHLSMDITFTSVGIGVSAICHVCGEEENLTDYKCW